MQYGGDKYTIWYQEGNKKPKAVKYNMDISQATSYITYERQSLANGERFFTENQESSKVDMFFTADSVITPDMPMYIYDGKLSKGSPKFRNTAKTMKMLDRENKKGNLKIGKKTPSKKSRGKWIGNMFKLSTKRLNQVAKTGTPKQKKLARKIISQRNK